MPRRKQSVLTESNASATPPTTRSRKAAPRRNDVNSPSRRSPAGTSPLRHRATTVRSTEGLNSTTNVTTTEPAAAALGGGLDAWLRADSRRPTRPRSRAVTRAGFGRTEAQSAIASRAPTPTAVRRTRAQSRLRTAAKQCRRSASAAVTTSSTAKPNLSANPVASSPHLEHQPRLRQNSSTIARAGSQKVLLGIGKVVIAPSPNEHRFVGWLSFHKHTQAHKACSPFILCIAATFLAAPREHPLCH